MKPIPVKSLRTQTINPLITPPSPLPYPEEEGLNHLFGRNLVGDSSSVPTIKRQAWDSSREKALGDTS
jgi:hypothetical protein